ncbi:MAG: Ig-like domain-containing protein, partial [Planctomycetota bacterium]
DTATLMITINGTNDGPTAVNDTNSVTEDTAPNPVNGDLLSNDSDPDANDTLTVTEVDGITDPATDITGSYGTLDWSADGTYSYTLDNSNPTVNAIAAGESLTESFSYAISDGNGGTDSATLTITINGTNDGPTAVNDTNSVTEDSAPNPVSGDLLSNDSDPDANDSLMVTEVDGVTDPATNIAGSYGTLDWSAGGTYGYTLDNSNPTVQALAVGETLIELFTYTISDGNGGTGTATLRIVINGTNEVPVAVDDSNSVSEDTALNPVIGDVLANDTDANGDSLQVTAFGGVASPGVDVNGSFGTLDWESDGTYGYTLDNSNPTVQALGFGESLSESFVYFINDGNGGTTSATLTIQISGTNDEPVANPDTNSVTEGVAPNPVSGSVLTNDYDPDGDPVVVDTVNGSPTAVGSTVAGSYGTLVLNGDGSYSYTLDNVNPLVAGLSVGATLTETFDYTISDGHGGSDSATLTITVQGKNQVGDAPPNFAFDAFNDEGDGDNSGQASESIGMQIGGRREILLSRLISDLAPEPILAGYAKPGTILVGRIYSLDGSIIGETTTTVDAAGNWVLQFFGMNTSDQTYVVIEHVASESVESSATNFRLTPDTYRSMQFSTQHDRAATIGTILSDAPYNSLAGEHAENLNPLTLLD